MGNNKKFDGYEPYDYLVGGEDYRQIDLATMFSGNTPREVGLSDDEEARVAEVYDETIISLHDHPFHFPADVHEDLWTYVKEGRIHAAYEFLSESPLDAVFDFHLDGLSGIHSKHGWKWDDIVHDVSMRSADIAHSDFAIRCRGVDDIHRANEEGKVAFVPALESAAMIENELDRIDLLYGMGVRLMGVTYNASNSVGTGQGDIYERDGGLTQFGVEAIGRMNDIGMAVSTSHSSKQTTLDVCEVSEKPVFDTHALAQTGGMNQRGTSDEELQALADTGGVIGVLSSTHLPDIETYMEHFEYMVDLVGIDHVAFGPDVLYGDHTSLLEVLASFHGVELPDSTMENKYVKGLENPTEAWNNIPRWLVKEGYSDEEIKKVLSGNILRALDEVW